MDASRISKNIVKMATYEHVVCFHLRIYVMHYDAHYLVQFINVLLLASYILYIMFWSMATHSNLLIYVCTYMYSNCVPVAVRCSMQMQLLTRGCSL